MARENHSNQNEQWVTRIELINLIRKLSAPLNLDELVHRGILKKVGSWYLIAGSLPDHVLERAKGLKQSGDRIYLRFPTPSARFQGRTQRVLLSER